MALPEPIPPLDSKSGKQFRKSLERFELTRDQTEFMRRQAQLRD